MAWRLDPASGEFHSLGIKQHSFYFCSAYINPNTHGAILKQDKVKDMKEKKPWTTTNIRLVYHGLEKVKKTFHLV
jgi:hypothetical protein